MSGEVTDSELLDLFESLPREEWWNVMVQLGMVGSELGAIDFAMAFYEANPSRSSQTREGGDD